MSEINKTLRWYDENGKLTWFADVEANVVTMTNVDANGDYPSFKMAVDDFCEIAAHVLEYVDERDGALYQ